MAINTTVLNKAIRVAKSTNVKRAKVCALALTNPSHVIAQAHNKRIDGDKTRFTEHAEIALIRKLRKIKAFERMGHITILVVRINTRGLVMAKPCKKCQITLRQYRDQITVLYSDEGQFKKLTL